MANPCSCDDLILETVPENDCAEDLDQVDKIGIQKSQPAGSPPFASAAEVQDLNNWVDLLDATDDTKMIMTPLIEQHVVPMSGAILEGGGGSNETLDGMPIAHDGEPVRVEAFMRSVSAAIRTAMKKIACVQTLDSPVEIFLINSRKKKVTLLKAGSAYRGIPAYAVFVGDPGSEGINSNDKTPFSYSLPYGWADDRAQVTVTWNARTELKPSAS